MDPISLSALVGLITQSAASEAGKSAWDGLASLVRRAFGHGQPAEAALTRAKDGDQGAILDLAGLLVQGAAADPELAGFLRAWIAQAQQATAGGAVHNTISGSARVIGDVVQARDISNLHFGRPPDDPAR